MTKKYDHLVFIARAQPFHKGHEHVVHTAAMLSKHVIILLGSANSSRTLRNPFTFEERKEMILNHFEQYPDIINNISILPLNDHTYNDTVWVTDVQSIVNNHLREIHPSKSYEEVISLKNLKISLIGHSKDNSSYYLKLFPTWGHVDVQGIYDTNHNLINATKVRDVYFDPKKILSATNIRDTYFSNKLNPEWFDDLLPETIKDYLLNWINSEQYLELFAEQKFVEKYKEQWSVAPYPVTFSTVDACVVQSGHILMVRRGAQPGLGKLALPGGFLEQNETLLDGALRELKEETGIKVPEAVLRGSLKKEKTFDDPYRSSRGRTITTAFLFHLFPQTSLPKVKGMDDAKDALWIPLSKLKAEDCFEDHFFIISNLTAGL